MADIFLEIKTRDHQQLRDELGIPENEIWAQYPEHGLEVFLEDEVLTRTAEWEAIVTLSCTVVGTMATVVPGVKWLYGKLKKAQVLDEVVILRRENAQLGEALAEMVKEAQAKSQAQAISTPPAPAVSTIPDLIEKLAILHEIGALTDEEFTKKKADLLARM